MIRIRPTFAACPLSAWPFHWTRQGTSITASLPHGASQQRSYIIFVCSESKRDSESRPSRHHVLPIIPSTPRKCVVGTVPWLCYKGDIVVVSSSQQQGPSFSKRKDRNSRSKLQIILVPRNQNIWFISIATAFATAFTTDDEYSMLGVVVLSLYFI